MSAKIPGRQAGLSLVDVCMAAVLIGTIAFFISTFYSVNIKHVNATADRNKATFLAMGLMEEAGARDWNERCKGCSALFGPDAGELATDKRTFDDIDDFNGYEENAALYYPDMTALSGFKGFTRKVRVFYVNDKGEINSDDEDDEDFEADDADDIGDKKNQKLVRVIVSKNGRELLRTVKIFSEKRLPKGKT